MKITIDEKILKENNITLNEFLVLLINYREVNLKDTSLSLVSKQIADKNIKSDEKIVLSENTIKFIDKILIDSDKNIINDDERYTSLAKKIREIYPKGRKEGTNYMWRGTIAEISHKLKTLVVKYNYSFTDEEVIDATKYYVESFNGNYTYMPLLKYFILKTIRDADGNVDIKSELMATIENKEDIDNERDDWTSNLV